MPHLLLYCAGNPNGNRDRGQVSVLPCEHAFHGVCIRKWLLMRNRCPTDMQPVVPDSPKKAK